MKHKNRLKRKSKSCIERMKIKRLMSWYWNCIAIWKRISKGCYLWLLIWILSTMGSQNRSSRI